ncbi:DMT family transporter [Exiguobacterium sp. SL-10]|jgi:transporter family-2 protein|uniref:DMT family transporter n=1 Tax=unclassified Exiguobacterium TaxID=2644629 RepID=UPI00103E1FCE|nr:MULTISPECIES: DMT family transporter [unclassified Exiguobacterium]TCI21096.1 DMT family transporter [Exiguobacterium sp. SL-9]TCI31146.1 DMT family transporter [Exiguobacterium sp. SL-10]
MIVGIICSAVAGAFISVQAAVNAKMNVYLGAWATTVLVFIVGLLGSLVPLVLFGGNLQGLFDISPIYALGGLLGVGVVFCVMRSIQLLGPTLSVSIILVSQLIWALGVDLTGAFGMPQLSLSPGQVIGLMVLLLGVIVFKQSQAAALQQETSNEATSR